MIKTFNPYYAVIFTSTQNQNIEGYEEMANKMERLAKQQPGYLGMDTAKNEVGITVSYWKSLEAIKHWKQQAEHVEAQQKGRNNWYSWYHIRICKVERDYEFNGKSN
ncbi:MAG TPA: antibiotic biosynthesis monooxygenase [Flavobacteriaceae bacterium]|nr:antibiotic biosynthesis monooxygenase [Flavobacteriaceae bacterium]